METTLVKGSTATIDAGRFDRFWERVVRSEKEDEWPLALLTADERAEVRRLATLLHTGRACLREYPTIRAVADYVANNQPSEAAPEEEKKWWRGLLQISQRLPSESEIREDVNRIEAAVILWYATVSNRGREATRANRELADMAVALAKKHDTLAQADEALSVREAALEQGAAALAEGESRLRKDRETLRADSAAVSAKLAHVERWDWELAQRGRELREIEQARLDAAAWWDDMTHRISAALFPSLSPLDGTEVEYTPSMVEAQALVAAADRLVRQPLALPEGVGVARLEGDYAKGLRVVKFGSWPVPHIGLRRVVMFSGRAHVSTLDEMCLRFGRVYLAWPKGVPIGTAAVTTAIETGRWSVPVPVLKALAAPGMVTPGVTPLEADQASVTFSVKGWPERLSLPRDVVEELKTVLAPGQDLVAALKTARVLVDPLVAELVKGSIDGLTHIVVDGTTASPVTATAPASPLARCIVALLDNEGRWVGTPSALLKPLYRHARALGISAAQLPATASALSRQLRRGPLPAHVALRWGRTKRGRWLRLTTDRSA